MIGVRVKEKKGKRRLNGFFLLLCQFDRKYGKRFDILTSSIFSINIELLKKKGEWVQVISNTM